jgi:hypothetical protein
VNWQVSDIANPQIERMPRQGKHCRGTLDT